MVVGTNVVRDDIAAEAPETAEHLALFIGDPFLSDPENFRNYIRNLRSAVVGRSRELFFSPLLLDIFDAAERQRFDRAPPTADVRPGLPLIQRYTDALCHKSQLSAGDSAGVRRLTQEYNPALTHNRYDANFTRTFDPSRVGDNCVRIAAISYHVGLSNYAIESHFGEHLRPLFPDTALCHGTVDQNTQFPLHQLGRTKLASPELGAIWTRQVKELLTTALNRRPHVICFPEFALPPTPKEFGDYTSTDIVEDFCNIIAARAGLECFVFCGTRHESIFNRGPHVHWQDGTVASWMHYKTIPARRLGENIMGRRGPTVPYCPLNYVAGGVDRQLQISVAICYDAFDPAFFGLLRRQLQVPRENIPSNRLILVPSFNRSPILVDALRDLSFLARCMVLYVNAMHGDATLFIDGFRILDVMEDKQLLLKPREALQQIRASPGVPPNQKEIGLDALVKGIDGIPESQMEDLVSVEYCAVGECKRDMGIPQASCNHDILYFSIPIPLLETIRSYRESYFLEELRGFDEEEPGGDAE